MNDEIFPRHFMAWKHCITEKCKIDLSKEYVLERIEKLSNPSSKERQTFIDKYGEHWTSTVLGYFKQAKDEL